MPTCPHGWLDEIDCDVCRPRAPPRRMRCRAVKVDIDDATDDGDRQVVIVHLADGVRSVHQRPTLVAFVELPADMAREIAEQLLSAADQIEARAADTIDNHAALARRVDELETAIRAMHAAIPGGDTCDPQQTADDLREIAARAGVTI